MAQGEEAPVPSGLERRDQSLREWERAIAARARIGQYRAGALDPAVLEGCLRSAATPRDVRVGAAIALANSIEPADRARLRLIAGELPQPSMRALVEQLAEGEAEEASIEAALMRREV
jgi:hypothetical protein